MPTDEQDAAGRLMADGTAPVTPLASRARVDGPPAKGRARRRSTKKLADPSQMSCPISTPTRSEGAIETGAKERSAMRKVALDLGGKKTTYCEVADGAVVQRATVSEVTSLRSLLGPDQPAATVAIEACREAWYVHDLLSSWDNQVLLVDTTRSRQLGIGQHGRKTDRIDAEVLARAVERGGIPLAHVLSPHRRELRRQIGVRRALVQTRANLVTTIRGLSREDGNKLPSSSTAAFAAAARKAVDNTLLPLLEPLLVTLEALEPQLAVVEQALGKLCSQEPVIAQLTTAPGVGALIAASFVSVIDDAKRFKNAHQVESYIGLVPSEHTTGGRRRVGAISKKGNPYLRALLVRGAWNVLCRAGAGDPLRLWGEAVAKRRGNRIAVIAVARRMVGILWAIWRDGSVYEPAALGRRSTRGVRKNAQELQFRAEQLARASRKASCRLLSQEVTQPS
jgi:transposase